MLYLRLSLCGVQTKERKNIVYPEIINYENVLELKIIWKIGVDYG